MLLSEPSWSQIVTILDLHLIKPSYPDAAAVLQEHLPYELDMLDAAFTFLHSPDYVKFHTPFCKNTAIESFWLHARNLIEFLTRPPSGGAGTVSAQDFTTEFWPETVMKEMDQRINIAITHLIYGRKSEQGEKLNGHEMLRVKQHIDREIKRFEKCLLPEFKKNLETSCAEGLDRPGWESFGDQLYSFISPYYGDS
jgi:hypothetical protein